MLQRGSESDAIAFWRVVPKRSAKDLYRRRFDTRDDADRMLAMLIYGRHYKVAPFNQHGKMVNA